jgi:hypothetical protein
VQKISKPDIHLKFVKVNSPVSSYGAQLDP